MSRRRSDELDTRFRDEFMRACLFVSARYGVAASTVFLSRFPEGSEQTALARETAWLLVCLAEGSDLPLETFITEPELREPLRKRLVKRQPPQWMLFHEYVGWRRGL